MVYNCVTKLKNSRKIMCRCSVLGIASLPLLAVALPTSQIDIVDRVCGEVATGSAVISVPCARYELAPRDGAITLPKHPKSRDVELVNTEDVIR